ncbi:MAG: TIGR04552 family protein, partial [Cyanobacteria bacterium REEB65]|nr:TIGR04552 family protein [Cyanobacteria bacterium REEB65]
LALAFIEEELLPAGTFSEIPVELPHDPVQLLLLAARVDHPLRDWACSVLRVCHVVAHGIYLPGRDRVAEACAQLEARLRPHLRTEGSKLFLGDIPLVRCDFKTEKPWNSLLLKLLCKKDSVAEEIYDQVGVRIVTQSRADTLLVIRYLADQHVVVYPNVKPSRSHNTLLELGDFRRYVSEARADLEAGRISDEDFAERLQSYQHEASIQSSALRNPYTDEHYRSVQFTTRIMISRKDDAGTVERYFFPFELQIMDEQAYRRNMVGKSNHQAYRDRQREAARRRVFPWLRSPSGALSLAANGDKGDALS